MSGWTCNDLAPDLAGTLLDGDAPVDLTSAQSINTHILRPDGAVIHHVATADLANKGHWSMAWAVGDLSVPGKYKAEVEVMWPGSKPQTYGKSVFPVDPEIA